MRHLNSLILLILIVSDPIYLLIVPKDDSTYVAKAVLDRGDDFEIDHTTITQIEKK